MTIRKFIAENRSFMIALILIVNVPNITTYAGFSSIKDISQPIQDCSSVLSYSNFAGDTNHDKQQFCKIYFSVLNLYRVVINAYLIFVASMGNGLIVLFYLVKFVKEQKKPKPDKI